LSDKLQVMMVPSDAKIFFNDVMKGTGFNPQVMGNQQQAAEADDSDDDSPAEQGQQFAARRR
jgi:hypothetical protein